MAKTPTAIALQALRSKGTGPSLGLNVLLVTGGAVLIYAGVNGVSVVDAALGRGSGGAAAAVQPGAASTATDAAGTVAMDGHQVAAWIAEELQWARSSGLWRGTVLSGVRSPAAQLTAARGYGLQHYGSAGPLGSHHLGKVYPDGAVDVTNPAQLAAALKRKPGGSRLVWAGPVIGDTSHFSSDGH